MAKIINSVAEFEEIIKSGTTLIDFYADWCGPCKMLGPLFEMVSQEVKGVNFIKINTDLLPTVADKFEIASIPTIVKIVNGKETTRKVGLLGKDALLELANK